MSTESRKAVTSFLDSARLELEQTVNTMDIDSIQAAAVIIQTARKEKNRLHVTGIGKPGHVAEYAASLFSSTGTPCYYLDCTEAVHGSSGQLVEGDVVICISNSGETAELMRTISAIKINGCKIIGVSGGRESSLAKESDAFLYAGVSQEGGPLNRAPRNSVLAEELVLQALSVALQADVNLTPAEYVKRSPCRSLGRLRENEV